jgi:hypothetical protein
MQCHREKISFSFTSQDVNLASSEVSGIAGHVSEQAAERVYRLRGHWLGSECFKETNIKLDWDFKS